ncbi:MAG TPA: hypothetical protein VGF91_17140 [Solirubrobacteraceae bacterium]
MRANVVDAESGRAGPVDRVRGQRSPRRGSLLTGNARSSLQPLPGDDERFHIVGGNDQLVSRMISQ